MKAALLSLLLLCGAPAGAVYPIRTAAPPFPKDDVWINAKPFSWEKLNGRRVVLVAFLNTANINSLRAIKVLNAWHDQYSLNGLMIIGIHTPIYQYQRDPVAVKADARHRGVEFPLVLDLDRELWNAYHNEGWPSFFLVDHKGRVIYDRVGEDRYTELESELRDALDRFGYRPPGKPAAADPRRDECGEATAEFSVPKDKPVEEFTRASTRITVVSSAGEGKIFKKGAWELDGDALKLTQNNPDMSSSARAVYRGMQALALLSPGPNHVARFYVKQDDLWLHRGNAGADVAFDADGQSYVEVTEPRLYSVTNNPNDNARMLILMPTKAGASFLGVSSADRCLPYNP